MNCRTLVGPKSSRRRIGLEPVDQMAGRRQIPHEPWPWWPTRTVPDLTDKALHLDETENRHEAFVPLKERGNSGKKFSLKQVPELR